MALSIKDIAKVCNVSYSTVSRVLNGKYTRNTERNQKIIDTARALGYSPHSIAKQLVQRRTETLGFVVPDIANPHYPEITKSVETHANAAGYQILFYSSNWDITREYDVRNFLLEKRVDGAIIMPVCDESHRVFQGMDIPVTLLGTRTLESVDFVVMNNVNAAFDATEFLINQRGCKTLVYIGRKMMNYTSYDRFTGLQMAAEKNKIPRDRVYSFISEDDHVTGGHSAVRALLREAETPVGILAFNDMLAMGMMEAVEDARLEWKKDASLIGFDDLFFSSFKKINLSTITPSKNDLGKYAVDFVLERIGQPHMPRQSKVLPFTMIERGT